METAGKGEEISRESVQSVEEVRQALEGNSTAVSRITGMSQKMAAASEEQSHVAEDISQQITRIAQLSDHSAAQAQQGAAIGQELEQMAEYLHSLAERLTVEEFSYYNSPEGNVVIDTNYSDTYAQPLTS